MSNTDENGPLTEPLDEKWVAHIWRRMLSIYGYKWHSHLGSAVLDDGSLSDSARLWSAGLSGLNADQIRHGFSVLIFNNHEWPPSLPEFRRLCLSGYEDKPPSLGEVVSILALAGVRGNESVKTRYKHPLALAIAGCRDVDLFLLRSCSTAQATRLIKPVYDRFFESGWDDWPEWTHVEHQAAIAAKEKVVDFEAARERIKDIRKTLLGGRP